MTLFGIIYSSAIKYCTKKYCFILLASVLVSLSISNFVTKSILQSRKYGTLFSDIHTHTHTHTKRERDTHKRNTIDYKHK
jgi:hypothetical protein